MKRCVTGSSAGTPLATKFSPIAEPDHERARDSRDDDAVRVLCVEYEQRVGADEALHREPHGLEQIVALLQVLVHEVRRDLGVGLRLELVALRDELGLDGLVVFDDAVVDHRDAIARDVRVRVRLCDAAVSGPARVRDTEPAAGRRVGELLLELHDLANRAPQAELVVRLEHCDPGRVIAAILEPLQPFDEHRHDAAAAGRDKRDQRNQQADEEQAGLLERQAFLLHWLTDRRPAAKARADPSVCGASLGQSAAGSSL